MSRAWRVLSFVTLSVVLCGGCPVDPGAGLDPASGSGNPGLSTGAGGSSTSPSGGTSGTTTDGTQDFEDQLSQQFPTCAEPISGDTWRAEVLRLVNLERERADLLPLTHSQTLEDQATQYACEMIYYDFFDHENPVTGTQLRDRAEEFDYAYVMIGENLAAGQSAAPQVMADWMNSEGHRKNVLEPHFTELGVGVRTGGRYGTYWVQEFGCPRGP